MTRPPATVAPPTGVGMRRRPGAPARGAQINYFSKGGPVKKGGKK